ncbi:cytochrome P450 [Pseudonocardia spirodelae]|uniref:Cytochrome P450 n=1 Tax=Pseudonocardia spirodelae TaxID=3133431 RepID=A0ABU8T3M2_9PSEU
MTAVTDPVPTYPMARGCPFDPPAELAGIREESAGVTRVRIWDGSTPWLVTRYDDVRAALADPRLSADADRDGYPAASRARRARSAGRRRSFIMMDDPEHARYRRMLVGEFTVRRIERLRPLVERTVTELLDAMAAGENPTDLVQAFALPLPSLVICHLLGVPYADHAFFEGRSRVLVDLTSGEQAAAAASDELQDYLAGLVRVRRAAPRDDLLGALADRVGAGELTEDEASASALLLLVAGHETTANMIALGTLTLLHRPDQLGVVRDGDDAQVRAAVEELLRVLTVTHTGRRRVATEDLELGGVTIRAGEGVVLAAETANRDPRQWEHPDEVDVARGTNRHVAFGFGVHQCLGQPLARLELQIAHPALLRRFPDLRVTVPDSQIAFRDEMAVYGVHALPVAF